MTSRHQNLWAITPLLALATACAPESGTEPLEPELEMGERFGLIEVSANAGRTGATEQRVHTVVHFVAHRGVERAAVDAALDAWTPPTELGCTVFESPAPASPYATVDLLNAGAVGVSGNGGATTLSPRFFGGGPNLSGFAYGGSQAQAPIWAPGEIFTVWGSGDEVGPFAFGLPAPERIQFVRVSGREVGSAAELMLNPSEDIEAEFFTDAREVYITLETLQPFGGPRAECRFEAIDGVTFDAAELTETFGDEDIEMTLRTATMTALPASANLEGQAVAQVYDRLVIRR